MNKSQDSFKLTTNKTKDYSPSNFNNEMNKVISIANDDNINYITNIKPIVSNTVFTQAITHHIPIYFENSNEI